MITWRDGVRTGWRDDLPSTWTSNRPVVVEKVEMA
jgi:hypothetical protein